MKETIVKFTKGPPKKKYTAYIKNKTTKIVRKIHFGASDYQQYKDRTPLKLYKSKELCHKSCRGCLCDGTPYSNE